MAPDRATWAAMSAPQRDAFLDAVLAAHSDPREAMSEGRPHRHAKGRALDELSLHFSTIGRKIYLVDEMAVVYPGQESFSPDLLAVLDVEQPAEDERMAWVVADEERGLDLVLEVLHRGNREKDLSRNVALYASLGIREYFVYDRLNFVTHGFRLPGPAAVEYRTLRPRLGRHTSQVLGLDLAVVEGRLRFFCGYAELIGSGELIGRLSTMMDEVEGRVQRTDELLRVAESRAEAEAERSRAAVERAQAESERARRRLQDTLQESILRVLAARGVGVPAGGEGQIRACQDPDLLSTWVVRAATVASFAELFEGP